MNPSNPLLVFSPAKINIFLLILAKREDGFHNIASVFQAIDLGDTLSFQISDQDGFTSNHPKIASDSSNLILKAKELFLSKVKQKISLKIDLNKRIPLMAGLGGGSSNAASTLWALNQLTNQPLSENELISLAAKLGSDVAFFFSSGTAYCTSRGERIKNIPHYPLRAYLACPDFGISTRKVFSNFFQKKKQVDPSKYLRSFIDQKPLFTNDLEAFAFALHPRMKKIKEELLQTFDQVMMSGSGSSFFCIGSRKPIPIKGITFYAISSIRKQAKSWYPLKVRQECLYETENYI